MTATPQNSSKDLAEVSGILRKSAEYVGMTQKQLDEYNEHREAFRKRAHQVAGVLANRGVIVAEKADAWADKVASDPSGRELLGFVEKLAGLVAPEENGGAKEASGYRLTDPFDRALFPEYANNEI